MARLSTLAFVLLLAAPRAWPCGNALRIIRQDARLVLAAEAALERCDYTAVFEIVGERDDERGGPGWLRRQWPDGLERRVELLRLRAQIGRGSNPAQLVEAARRIEELQRADPDSPSLTALYAQALAAAGEPRLGRTLLEDLAARDLVPDAAAWRTLADLRAAARDPAAPAARARCRAATKYPKTCDSPSPNG